MAKLAPLDRALHQAAAAGDLELVRELLAQGADPNSRERRKSVLDRIPHHHDELKCLLIEAGADQPEMKGWLVWAVNLGRPATVKRLIQLGADLNLSAPMGTPLTVAAGQGTGEIVEILIEAGADLNASCGVHNPLTQAIDGGHPEMVERLLEAGANPNQTAEYSQTPPLVEAARRNCERSAVALLRAGADPNRHAPTVVLEEALVRVSPLHLAAVLGNSAMAKELVQAGADANAKDGQGKTPFDWARERGHTEVERALASTGARQREASADELLLEAARQGKLDSVREALAAGADLEARDGKARTQNFTPLLLAAFADHTDICRELVERGAQVDALDLSDKIPGYLLGEMEDEQLAEMGYLPNRTPLLWALVNGNEELACFLIERGADVEHKDHFGLTPMLLAARQDSPQLLDRLREAGAKVDKAGGRKATALLEACAHGAARSTGWLLKQKVKLERKNSYKETPLLAACSDVHVEIIEMLLGAGAEPNAIDGLGYSPLAKLAIASRQVPCSPSRANIFNEQGTFRMEPYPEDAVLAAAELLLAAGADPTAGQANTLCLAAQSNHARLIGRLIEAGANPNKAGQFGTPFEVAKMFNHEEAMAVLKAAGGSKPSKAKKEKPVHPRARTLEAPDLSRAMTSADFEAAVDQVSELCRSAPVRHPDRVEFHVDTEHQPTLDTLVLQREFHDRGYFLFESSGSPATPVKLSLIPSARWQDALAVMQTNGINCDVGTLDIVEWLEELQKTQPFEVVTVGHDLVGGRFQAAVKKAKTLAKRIYRICPDAVDQGSGTVDELAAGLKADQAFYLWWD